ncbi:MAG: DUF4402 domain-containing protein [Rhodospirillales bacterium]|nr:DUF4402 domain-containing protein [Rhodospirillales bacterium]
MNKLNVLAVSVFAAATLISASAMAASVNSTATVTIKTPIAVAETTALSFGTVIPTVAANSATVVLDFSDSATSANATITGATSGDFNVTGAGSSAFTLSGLGTVQMTGTGTDMPLVLSSSPAAGSLALSSGALPIVVGGSLTVGANQLSGAYTASYAVTVNYN